MADPNLSVFLRNIDCMSDSSEEPDRISNFNVVKGFVYIPDKAQSVAYRAKKKTKKNWHSKKFGSLHGVEQTPRRMGV